MTTEELEILIKQGEDYNIAFKSSFPSKARDLADEICAFANAAGGIVIVGIDDKGNTIGVTIDNITRPRLQNVFSAIEPLIEVSIQELTRDGKTFEGSLIEQYNGAFAYLYQKLNLNYIIEGAGPRKEILEIPEEALKEALVNLIFATGIIMREVLLFMKMVEKIGSGTKG